MTHHYLQHSKSSADPCVSPGQWPRGGREVAGLAVVERWRGWLWWRGGGAGCGGEVAGLAVAPLEDDEQQGEHSVLITAAKPTRA